MSFLAVFGVFLRLGLTAFGGPVAHLGYFRDEFVARRRWLDDRAYGELIALCQFLPGPASSQAGFALGWMRAGWRGGLAAWLGFTLPSALALTLLALALPAWQGAAWAQGALHGLKLVAVAVVAQAVWGMARALCVDRLHVALSLLAVFAVVFVGGAAGQVAAIAVGAAVGALGGEVAEAQARPAAGLVPPIGRRGGTMLLLAAILLLAATPLVRGWGHGWALFDAFYRAGALVFGGGHVVLPLLQTATVEQGWVTQDAFLAGYGLAQAVPGPLFTFAAWLGAVGQPVPGGLRDAAVAVAAIFLPGLLLVAGTLPWWRALRDRPRAAAAVAGAGAAVVGVLAAALYDPVWRTGVNDARDFAWALAAFLLLARWRLAPWKLVLLAGLGGAAAAAGLWPI